MAISMSRRDYPKTNAVVLKSYSRRAIAHPIHTAHYLLIISILCYLCHSTNYQKKMEQIDDASTELMMGSGDRVMLHLGTAFLECSEEEATEHCEKEVDKVQVLVDALVEEEEDILEQQKTLKIALYARFGKSINLEEK